MKKSTERKRIKRMQKDLRQLFTHGLISAKAVDSIGRTLTAAARKL